MWDTFGSSRVWASWPAWLKPCVVHVVEDAVGRCWCWAVGWRKMEAGGEPIRLLVDALVVTADGFGPTIKRGGEGGDKTEQPCFWLNQCTLGPLSHLAWLALVSNLSHPTPHLLHTLLPLAVPRPLTVDVLSLLRPSVRLWLDSSH